MAAITLPERSGFWNCNKACGSQKPQHPFESIIRKNTLPTTEGDKIKYNSNYVKKSSFVFIQEYRKSTGSNPTGILFNKYMVLLNRKLLSEGTDIHLPHCWYRRGDEVVRYSMPYLDWEHGTDKTFVSFRAGDAPNIDNNDPVIKAASEYAREFIMEYGGKYGHEEVVDETYSEAPYPFQNDYRKLRESLKLSRLNNPYSNFDDYIMKLLDDVKASYPPEFRKIRPQFDMFTSVFEMALGNKASNEDLFDMTESFWFYFCYFLRLDKKCHSNISAETLETWRSILPQETGVYEQIIQNTAAAFYSEDCSDKVVKELLRAREQRLKEIDELLSELD